jgi:hypothetical protein
VHVMHACIAFEKRSYQRKLSIYWLRSCYHCCQRFTFEAAQMEREPIFCAEQVSFSSFDNFLLQ